ncbi:hypothetical protein [Streptomyces lushanensis]|uniref:hypothetical protein n=1 Tax=Streptomyces lushanensis TaxID=1434255 RepID=UPI000833DAAD|nr:hypothetical protein [Streptomyces lushanensis]
MPELTCPRCRHQGQQHRWWAHRHDGVICPRCHLTERITEVLDDGTGQVSPALLPLHEAIRTQPRPDAGLVWLVGNRHIAPLLADLATGRLPLSHESLNDHPSPQSAAHLRDLLVQHKILEQRDRYLVQFEAWLSRTLASVEPAEDRELIGRFATGHILRLRERATREPLTPGLVDRPQHEINSAKAFLVWLRDHGATPATCAQDHIDTWIATGSTSRQGTRAFITWGTGDGAFPRHLSVPYNLQVTRRRKPARGTFDHEQRLRLLRDILDPATDYILRDRAAFIILILFAQPLAHITALTIDDLALSNHEVRISIDRPHEPRLVPDPFAPVLRDHALNRGPRNVEANRTSPWLFPGNRPGQHIHAKHLKNHLSRYGIEVTRTHLAVLRALAQEMPPAATALSLASDSG